MNSSNDDKPDIVERIQARIAAFQRSPVKVSNEAKIVSAAARVGDPIKHTSFWSALAGAAVGACISAGIFALSYAAVVAAGITGG